jgi:S-(hydroxymethyl)glutathione dehydrogenase / alcohol dehydrogenase
MIPLGRKIELHGADFLRNHTIQGTCLVELWRQGQLKLDTLISARINLEQIDERFATLNSGAPVRQLIEFQHRLNS